MKIGDLIRLAPWFEPRCLHHRHGRRPSLNESIGYRRANLLWGTLPLCVHQQISGRPHSLSQAAVAVIIIFFFPSPFIPFSLAFAFSSSKIKRKRKSMPSDGRGDDVTLGRRAGPVGHDRKALDR